MNPRAGTRQKYLPPARWERVPSREAGITNGLSEKFPFLYLAGDRSLIEKRGVAIVGSRKASEAGRNLAIELARALVDRHVIVVSGLAEGIDVAAHEAAIAAGGKTIAVIGTPLENAYPAKHGALQERIYREHLLVSQFAPGTRTFPSHFPERNKVMARITRATVIIEASDTSGTLHQAAECDRVGAALFIARPTYDDPRLTWPKRFKKAHVMDTPEDVLAEIF